jgi:tripartite-type tricarboxylate transporter receptor subunit TctC
MESLGQQIVIDNRPGGSSVIGTEITARAAPDGYTLVLVTTTHTVNPSLIQKLPYDAIADFAPVSLIVSQPNILVVSVALPVKSVNELIALARSKAEYDQLCLRRQRQLAASHRRIAEIGDGHPDHATSLTRAPDRRSSTCSAGTCR